MASPIADVRGAAPQSNARLRRARIGDGHGQLVAPDVAAAKIVRRIVRGPIEQGRTYSYAEL